jgi:hypothetical protein
VSDHPEGRACLIAFPAKQQRADSSSPLLSLVRSTSLPEVVDDFRCDSLRRLLAQRLRGSSKQTADSATTARFR